jgi:hypothetical protein
MGFQAPVRNVNQRMGFSGLGRLRMSNASTSTYSQNQKSTSTDFSQSQLTATTPVKEIQKMNEELLSSIRNKKKLTSAMIGNDFNL